MRVDGDVVRVLASERRRGGAVLQEVAGHPVVRAGTSEVLHRLAEVASVRLGAPFAGRPHQHEREARLEGHGDEGGLAVARDSFDPHALGVDRGQRLEVVERAGCAPGPRPQRPPLLGRPAVALVGEADDALGQTGAVVGLDAGGAERHVTPASGDELLGGGRSGGLLEAREPRQRLAGHVAPAEHHQDRNRSFGIHGHDDRHLDVHRDRGVGGVVDVPDHPPGHDRLAADRRLHGLGHRPGDLRHAFGHAAVDLALEVEGDLRTPLLPPLLRGRDLAAVLQRQDVRPVRIRVGLGRIVVRRARLAGGCTAVEAGPKLRDAQSLHHLGVVFARELIQARALLGTEQERVRRGGRRGGRGRWRLGGKPRGQDAHSEKNEDTPGDWHEDKLRSGRRQPRGLAACGHHKPLLRRSRERDAHGGHDGREVGLEGRQGRQVECGVRGRRDGQRGLSRRRGDERRQGRLHLDAPEGRGRRDHGGRVQLRCRPRQSRLRLEPAPAPDRHSA